MVLTGPYWYAVFDADELHGKADLSGILGPIESNGASGALFVHFDGAHEDRVGADLFAEYFDKRRCQRVAVKGGHGILHLVRRNDTDSLPALQFTIENIADLLTGR